MSKFKEKRERKIAATLDMMNIIVAAPDAIKAFLILLSRDIHDKDYKMATIRCEHKADELDKFPDIRDRLCVILPDYALFVSVREKARAG